MATQTGQFDVETLRRGFEERDAEALTSLFAEDAECMLIDKANPPSNPRRFHGRDEIAEYNRDLAGREMTHRVDNVVVGDRGAAFADACEYPDGTRVYCTGVLDLDDGKISRQVCVQAWDE